MPGLRNQGHHRTSDVPKKNLAVALVTAVSQTDLVAFKFTPGFRFEIVSVRSYNAAKAGTISYKVKAGTRTAVSAGVFTAATEVAATLSTTKANIRGSSSEAISVEYTSDGSGALTNGFVVIVYRPWPLNGELGPST